MKAIITKNGRPAGFGSLFHEDNRVKWCCGYCPECKEKIGMTTEEIEEFGMRMPGKFYTTLWRLMRMKLPR